MYSHTLGIVLLQNKEGKCFYFVFIMFIGILHVYLKIVFTFETESQISRYVCHVFGHIYF